MSPPCRRSTRRRPPRAAPRRVLAALSTDDRLQHALGLACRYLNRSDRTEAEVRRHLAAKGVDDGSLNEAIQALGEQGLLDDTRFARMFTQEKRELEQWGSERIRSRLLARGVDRHLVEATLAAHPAAHDCGPLDSELARALELLRRRFPSPPRDRREQERALGILLRKGYNRELALDALRAHAREQDGRD
jgi:regulatory protein